MCVLADITDRPVSADRIEAAVAAYAAYINRDNREQPVRADVDLRALVKIERAVAGITAAINDSLYQPTVKARMAELEHERGEITVPFAEALADRHAQRP